MEKILKVKWFLLAIDFWTKCEVSTHEVIKRVLCLPMRHSNIDVLYVPTCLKNGKMLVIINFRKMHLNDTNFFVSNIIDRYKNRPNNLHLMCLRDFTSSKKAKRQMICQ